MSDTYVTGKGKSRNRPGYEKSAIQNTRRLMNFQNMDKSKGKGGKFKGMHCYRCGSADHLARSCRLPFQPIHAFNSLGKDGKKGNRIMLTDSIEEMPLHLVEDKTHDSTERTEPELGTDEGIVQEVPKEEDQCSWGESWIPDEEWMNQRWKQTCLVQAVKPDDNPNRTLWRIMPEPGGITELDQKLPFHALLDSGASYSAVGIPWISRWCETMPSAGSELWKRCSLGSFRKFKFGSGSIFPSKGIVLLNALMRLKSDVVQRLVLQIELVDVDAPLLISRRSLAIMGARIDFSTNILEMRGGGKLPLLLSDGGHLLLEIRPAKHPLIKTSSFSPVYVQDSVAIDSNDEIDEVEATGPKIRKKDLSTDDIPNAHKQLGRASHSALSQLLRQAGRLFSDHSILDALNKCNFIG